MIDYNNELYIIINQIIALKQACFLFRRITHSCGSLSSDLFSLKMNLIHKLNKEYNFNFDEDFMERDGMPQQYCKTCNSEMYYCFETGDAHHGKSGHWTGATLELDHNHKAVPSENS